MIFFNREFIEVIQEAFQIRAIYTIQPEWLSVEYVDSLSNSHRMNSSATLFVFNTTLIESIFTNECDDVVLNGIKLWNELLD